MDFGRVTMETTINLWLLIIFLIFMLPLLHVSRVQMYRQVDILISKTRRCKYYITLYCIWEKICGGNFCSFCGFSLDRESFLMNYGLVDQQYKSIELLQQKFYRE